MQDFKIGDRVRVKSLDTGNLTYCNRAIGDLGRMRTPINDKGGYVKFAHNTTNKHGNSYDDIYVQFSDLELVEAKQKYKVGDLVVITTEKDPSNLIELIMHNYSKGDICVIEDVPSDFSSSYGVRRKLDNMYQGVFESDFTLFKPNESEKRSLRFLDSRPYEGLFNVSWDLGFTSPKKPARAVMQKVKTLASKLLDSDVKALIKAGWLDSELEVTEEGEEAILTHYVMAHKEELAKEARKKIKEDEKACK